MSIVEYKGFGGLRLSADLVGDENDPAILLLPDAGQGRDAWRKVADALKASGTPALMMPRNVIALAELPLLGSGKTDYQALNRLAREKVAP